MNKNDVHFLNLLWEMTINDLKLRYKNTALGFLWVIINPIIQAIIIGYIFQFLYKVSDNNYKYYLFLNLLIWNFFSSSLEYATPSIVRNRAIIKKTKFPYIVIPLSNIFCDGIHLVFSLILFSIFVYIFHITGIISIWMMLIGCILLILFTAGLSLITSALNVRSRDINFLTRAVLMVWFYATPIVYPIIMIPNNIRYLWNFNPLTEIIMFFQSSLFDTRISLSFIFLNSLLIFCTVISGILIFRKNEDNFSDHI